MAMGGCQRKRSLMRKEHRAKKRRAEREQNHTVSRAGERFRIELSEQRYRHLTKLIRKGKARLIGRRSENADLYEVILPDGRKAIALFDRITRTIATIMHPSWFGSTTK